MNSAEGGRFDLEAGQSTKDLRKRRLRYLGDLKSI